MGNDMASRRPLAKNMLISQEQFNLFINTQVPSVDHFAHQKMWLEIVMEILRDIINNTAPLM